MNIKAIPQIIANEITVCTAPFAFFLLPCPIALAITTLAPMENPTNKLTIRLITGLLPPTAAKASLPANLPATATSAELNNCCKILLAAKGSANNIILSAREPRNMSTCFDFFCFTLLFILNLIFLYANFSYNIIASLSRGTHIPLIYA